MFSDRVCNFFINMGVGLIKDRNTKPPNDIPLYRYN